MNLKNGIFTGMYRRWLLLFTIAAALVQFVWVSPSSSEVDVIIARGSKATEIGEKLAEREVIQSQFLFRALVSLQRQEEKLQAGVYRFPPHVALPNVIAMLLRGGRPLAAMVRIPEGSSSREIARILFERMHIPEEAFLAIVQQPSTGLLSDFPWLPEQAHRVGLEGYLFGDTYELRKDSRAEEVVRKMLFTFEQKALPVLKKAPKGYPLNLHETLTLASIVEREVATWEDRRLVTDLFLRRLRYTIALQADSTVNFVTGKNVSRASLTDLETVSPYNTYKVRGLPPGPIANPTVLTFWAVIQPLRNPYWYFLTDRAGTVYYSRTFAEHVQKKMSIYGRKR